MDPKPGFPLPPDELSLVPYVEQEWKQMLESERKGHFYTARQRRLEERLEEYRIRIEKGQLRAEFDWGTDWRTANAIHQDYLDFAAWERSQRVGRAEHWRGHLGAMQGLLQDLSVEGIKAILLAHGAMALTALVVLSGQVQDAQPPVLLAGTIALVAAVIGMTMVAIAHLIIVHWGADAVTTTRGSLRDSVSLEELDHLGDYFKKSIIPKMQWANRLAYGSVFVFVAGAILSTVALLWT